MPTVAGLFDERGAAERAVRDLVDAEYASETIGLLSAGEPIPGGQIAYETDNAGAEGLATGAGAGAIIGGAFGLLVGATVIAVPGAALLAAGPLAGLISGAVIGATSGGLLGGLIGLGIPRTHAEAYAEGVRRGGVVVTVDCKSDEQCVRAEHILGENGAADIEERSTYYREGGWTGYDAEAPAYTPEQIAAERETLSSRNMPVPPPAPVLGREQGQELEIATMEPFFRSDYLSRFGDDAGEYEKFAPAYRWGYRLSGSTLYAKSKFDEIESDLRSQWEMANPGTWDRYRGAVHYAWDRARVRTSNAELF